MAKITKRPRVPKTSAVELPPKVARKSKTPTTGPEKVERKSRTLTGTGARVPWFHLEGKAAAAELASWIHEMRSVYLAPYRRDVLENMRLYAGSTNINGTRNTLFGKQLRYNIGRSIVDTAASILSAARTLPYNQTRGADWKLRRKVMQRNAVLQQQVMDVGLFEEIDKAIVDALVCRVGAVKFFEDGDAEGGLARCERLLPLSLVWDPRTAVASDPRDLAHIGPIDRDVLIEMFPDYEDAIRKAPGPNTYDKVDFQVQMQGEANTVMVYEAWHLPSGAEATDGRHILCVPGAALVEEDWTSTRFPVAFLRGWEPSQLGFTGVSLIDVCKPAQLRLEQLADHVQRCQTLGSNPRVFLKKGSMVEPEQITNTALQTHLYDGDTPPVFFQFDATPHDLEATFEHIREQTLSMLGISSQQLAGEKPAGITSAVGQKAAEDISSKRHVRPLRFLERFVLACAQCLVDVNDRIATTKPDFAIDMSVREAWLESAKWKDLMTDEKDAKLAVLPVSALVGSASAQQDTVQSWVQAGWVSQQTAKMLAAMPDTEGEAEIDTEDTIYSNYLVDLILDQKPIGVPPELDVTVFAPILRTSYLKARRDKAPEPVLQQFRTIMASVKARDDQAKTAAAAAQQGAQGGGAPGPVGPQSFMLPGTTQSVQAAQAAPMAPVA